MKEEKKAKGLEQTFLKRRHADGQQKLENMFASLIIKEMEIKTTMRYHFTCVRLVIIKKVENHKGRW
jgi:hypothetical protein